MNDFIEVLEKNFSLIPEKNAVHTEKGIFTYGDISVYSSRVYSFLKRKGIKANDVVMLNLKRTIDQIISCIGVLKAGAAFLFTAPNQNPESIRYIYEESGCKLLIDDTNIRQILNEKGINGYEPADFHDLAYVQYTSGSMRNPKGAMLERGAMALCNEFLYFRGKNIATAEEVHKVALLSPLSFAAGMIVMNTTLAIGMTLFDVPRDVANSPVACKEYFTKNKITTCFMTPSYYRLFNGFNPEMSVIILGGERVKDIRTKADGPAIYNIYSQSESGFIVALHRVSGEETEVPVGLSGIRGISIRLLDDNGSPIEAGETGEICYDNPYFRGYVGETKKAVSDGIFHSGDIGKILGNGELLVVGRKNDMVKVHGLWLNLQEIETVFQECYGTDWCFARCVTEKTKVSICVYYTGKKELQVQQVREELKALLPEHMLPTHIFRLEQIPTNKNGKLQIQKLPLPGKEASPFKEKTFMAGLEQELSEVIRSVVESPEEIGRNVNLISLGLSSLSAVMLIGLLEEKYHIRLTLSEVMDRPDIEHIAILIKEKEGSGETAAVSTNYHREYFPLTKNQLGVLAECEANKNSVQYNIPAYISFSSSELTVSWLKEAATRIFEEHNFINTKIVSGREVPLKYRVSGAEVYQKITAESPIIEVLEQENDFPDEVSEKKYFQELVVPFDIFDEKLYRVKILRTPTKIYIFVDVHHIITDGFSLKIIADDISSLLAGKSVQSEKVTFPEYISCENSSAFIEEDKEYINNLMCGVETFKYPYYSQETGSRFHRTDEIKTLLPKGSIPSYCQEKGFTESSYFHSALMLTLYLLTGEAPFIATTYNGRAENAIELMRTFGFFAKSVPVIWREPEGFPTEKSRTVDFIGGIQEQILQTCSHRNVIYSDLRVKSDVLMSFQGELAFVYVDQHEAVDLQLETPKFPIHFQIRPREKQYQISLLYDISCFKKEDMQLLYDSFLRVLSCLKRTACISDIPIVDGDVVQFLSSKSGEKRQLEPNASWLNEFYKQVKLRPDSEAVLAENGSFSYRELNEASDKIANFLVEHGVKADDFVAVKMPRIKEFSAAIVGIHKCGAAYIPIDPTYPEGRISYILEDSGSKLLLTEEITAAIFENEHRAFDERAGNIAYMIYTSGSTGLPKGVKISHHALMNYLKYVQEKVGVNQTSRISCYASFSFDISVEGLFTPLIAGGTVCIVPSFVRKDVRALEGYLRETKVTGGCFPTQIGQLLGHDKEMEMDYITLIGEKMTAIPGNKGRVFNAYGPTEATVVVTYYEIEKGREYSDIPIGRPMYNTLMLILDPFGNLLPDGAAGELCIAGPQLSEGYHNNEEKTAHAFTPLRQFPNIRIYHTGDMAKYLPDGNLMFLGRLDRQIKRSGFRIEPGEIENVALQDSKLKEAVVQSKNGKLILYYTLKVEDKLIQEELVKSLKEKLPSYMIPDGFMQLSSMPLTPNGKLDVNKLPEYHFESVSYIPPKNERELELCSKFAQLLRVKKVGINDDFFELGGNSLDAVQLSVMLGEDYELSDIYNGRTVSGIIKESENRKRVGTPENRRIYPLTEEQKKFFFVEEMGARPEVSYANVPMLFQLPDDTDMQLLQTHLARIVNNHPYLKVRFRENPECGNGSEEWYVAVRDDSILPEVHLYLQDKFDKKTLIKPYNLLGNENLYRIALYDIKNDGKYLFLDFHHVLYDGESFMIMIDELKKLMAGNELVPETVTGYEVAVDELERKEKMLEQIVSFYHELLKDSDKKLNDWINDRRDIRQRLQRSKVFDESHGVAALMGSRIICVTKSRVDMTHVRRRCSELHITENMFFNAAFACMLGECNGKSEALYANVIKNRDYAALGHTVTMMCRTVPVYLKVTEDILSDPAFIKQLRKSIADAKKGSLLSYEDICNRNNIIVPRITMILRERPADEEIVPGCREIGLDNLETIDSLMVKIYFDKEDNLYIKFDTSLDFERTEVDMMSERLDELISKI